MTEKKHMLDPGTADLVKKLLALPPKQHKQMKLGRTTDKKKRGPKDRASSSKRRTAS